MYEQDFRRHLSYFALVRRYRRRRDQEIDNLKESSTHTIKKAK